MHTHNTPRRRAPLLAGWLAGCWAREAAGGKGEGGEKGGAPTQQNRGPARREGVGLQAARRPPPSSLPSPRPRPPPRPPAPGISLPPFSPPRLPALLLGGVIACIDSTRAICQTLAAAALRRAIAFTQYCDAAGAIPAIRALTTQQPLSAPTPYLYIIQRERAPGGRGSGEWGGGGVKGRERWKGGPGSVWPRPLLPAAAAALYTIHPIVGSTVHIWAWLALYKPACLLVPTRAAVALALTALPASICRRKIPRATQCAHSAARTLP